MGLKIFLVDDYQIVRVGLVRLLSSHADFEVVGEASSAEEALAGIEATQPDVIVLDQRLPGMNAIELCRELAERRVSGAVVILSAYLDEASAWSCLAAGARGYVLKDAKSTELLLAIRAAARGEMHLDPKVAATVVGWAARSGGTQGRVLTPAVLRVLRLAIDGHSNAQIARMTKLSQHTVKAQLATAYRKLGVRDRTEAAAVALRKGLI